MRTRNRLQDTLRRGYSGAAAAALLQTISRRCLTTASSSSDRAADADMKRGGNAQRDEHAGASQQPMGAASASSCPSRTDTSSTPEAPAWVERSLHYDAEKVRRLAGVLAGEAASSREPLLTPASASSVEQHLRLRNEKVRHQSLKVTPTSPRARGGLGREPHQGVSSKSAAGATSTQRAVAQEKWETARTAAAWLVRLPSTRVIALVQDLVKLQKSALPAGPSDEQGSSRAVRETPDSAEVVLTSLLSSSRLAHYLRDPAAVSLTCCVDASSETATPPSTLTGLLVLVSAVESCVIARLGAGAADAAAHPEQVAECTRLVRQLVAALTEELAPRTSSTGAVALSDAAVRVDLLPLAVCSLVKLTDLCAFHTRATGPKKKATTQQTSATELEESVVSTVAENLQRLLCAMSEACVATVTSPARLPIDHRLEHYYGTATISLLAGQSEKLRRQLRVVDTAPAYAGCITAMQTTLLVYTVVIMRRVLAAERQRPDIGASSGTGMGASFVDGAGVHRLLTDDEKVYMAKVLEGQWAEMHAGDKVSAAEKSQLQHRTANTGLNASLSVWWKAASSSAAAAAAAATHSGSSPSRTHRGTGSLALKGRTHWCTRDPHHVAVLLGSYSALLTECRCHCAARSSDPAAPAPFLEGLAVTADSSVVPLYSRLVRVGLEMQLAVTCNAALCLGIEPRAPPTPSTPLSTNITARRRQRQSAPWRVFLSEVVRGRNSQLAGEGEDGDGAGAVGATAAAPWGRLFRLASGLRLSATELLHSAVLRLSSQRSSLPAAVAAASRRRPVVSLVEAVSSSFFAVPRTEYLFGLYTDDRRGEAEAEEAHRRVLAAALGVLLWLRELDGPFSASSQATTVEGAAEAEAQGAAGLAHQRAGWGVCGTRVSHALDAAFFLCYYHHHWPRGSQGFLTAATAASSETLGTSSPLNAALQEDGVVVMTAATAAPAPVSVGALLTSGAPTAYVKEVLFRLQHDTGRQLRHLRTTGRLHHFSGELHDRTKLLSEEVLRQRHVRAILSFVQAHVLQPTLLWMPLSQAQELVFILEQHPDLLRSTSDGAERAADSSNTNANLDEDVPSPLPGDAVRTYPKVHVGDVTCTFARLHGYLVRRLHVLSGVLREYRSLLLQSTSGASTGSLDALMGIDLEGMVSAAASGATSQVPAPLSLQAWLKKNAAHSPQLEVHLRNNRHWANAWAVMLQEEYPRLPAQMEGAPRWGAGVVRTLDRMERTMYETHAKGLFINVVRAQQQYRELRRIQADAQAQLHFMAASNSESGEAPQRGAADSAGTSNCEPQQELNLQLERGSASVPLGVVLDGDGHVVRVQATVLPHADANDTAADVALPSPFARAVARCDDVDGADVVGWRVVLVDGVRVVSGREVATQVSGKTSFTVTLQRR